jgi:hypothetical protein
MSRRKSIAAAGAALGLISFGMTFGVTAPVSAKDGANTDRDEAELLTYFDKVDVWHYPVDTTVRYNNQDAVVTREAVMQPAPAGELCYIRFDLIKGEGDFGYGLKPAGAPGSRSPNQWGVNVLKRGTVLNQYYSALKLNAVYFLVEGPKTAEAGQICARKQAAATPEAGNAYKGPWSDLVTKVRAIHGWPTGSQ